MSTRHVGSLPSKSKEEKNFKKNKKKKATSMRKEKKIEEE